MNDARHSKDAGPTDRPTQMEGDRPPEPDLAEVESARTLQAEAKNQLIDRDLDDEEIRKAADEYIAKGGSGDVEDFIDWVLKGLDREGAVDG